MSVVCFRCLYIAIVFLRQLYMHSHETEQAIPIQSIGSDFQNPIVQVKDLAL